MANGGPFDISPHHYMLQYNLLLFYVYWWIQLTRKKHAAQNLTFKNHMIRHMARSKVLAMKFFGGAMNSHRNVRFWRCMGKIAQSSNDISWVLQWPALQCWFVNSDWSPFFVQLYLLQWKFVKRHFAAANRIFCFHSEYYIFDSHRW